MLSKQCSVQWQTGKRCRTSGRKGTPSLTPDPSCGSACHGSRLPVERRQWQSSAQSSAHIDGQQQASRRQMLLSVGAVQAGLLARTGAAQAEALAMGLASADSSPGLDSLLQRLQTTGEVQALGPAAPWAQQTLFYPRWMFGEWDVQQTLQASCSGARGLAGRGVRVGERSQGVRV